MRDLIYYYDKTTFEKHELGEIQIGFNQSFVIDGTKDSKKVEVYSFNGKRLEPNTIIFHLGTQSWWIVSHDKVERYESEQTPLYLHNLQLEGAIELFNARDLTDNGFNDYRYDVDTFIKRLLALSTFEFNHTDYNGNITDIYIDYQNNIAPSKTVDYIKTFENYTLLSALREFLDGYNCSAKLEFIENNNTLIGAKLVIVSKTGNSNKPAIYGEQIFKDPRETKNTDKNNFGTSVVSNAENVVSTKTKTYPSLGGVRLSSTNGMEVKGDNAVLRLPSNIFNGNYLNVYNTRVPIWLSYDNQVSEIGYYDASNENSINNAITFIQDRLASFGVSATITKEQLEIFNIKLPYCDNYDAVNDLFITNEVLPTINIPNHAGQKWVFTNDELKPNIKYPDRAVSYSRNRNYISGFEAFFGGSNHKSLEVFFQDTTTLLLFDGQSVTPNVRDLKLGIGNRNGSNPDSVQYIDIKYASFSVNYIPMSDIKIKYDNDGDTIDTNLFNQNGKLNDSNALSKVLLSHSKEIESETITRYGTFYGGYSDTLGFVSNLPQVGDVVYINDDYYVINNISLDFQPNENINEDEMGYYITAEVSMSKKVATKSLMTNPNTNIRDYGIPQNNNVKRKQLYRDFYEFSYESDDNASDNWLLPLNKVLNLSNSVRPYQEHIGVINCRFSHEVNGNDEYYYQLETTTYYMKKAVYEILDFKDNNIIGYGYQNLWSGFDISKVLSGYNSMVDLYTIPISYVDEVGEIEEINIRFATIDQLSQVYDDYLEQEGYVDPQTGQPVISIYNASVFVPSDIYDNLNNNCDFEINETYYKKDALEVPVFEYSCQIDDTNEILVGENILDRGNNDVAYLYSHNILLNNKLYNDNNFENEELPSVDVDNQNIATISNAVLFDETHIEDQEPYLLVKLYASQSYDIDDNVNTMGSEISLDNIQDKAYKSLMIVRHNITSDDLYKNVIGELYSLNVYVSLPTASAVYVNKYIVYNGNYYDCYLTSAVYDLYTTDIVNDLRITDPTNPSYINPVVGKTIATQKIAYNYPDDSVAHNIYNNVVYDLNEIPTASGKNGLWAIAKIADRNTYKLAYGSVQSYSMADTYPTDGQLGKYMITSRIQYNYPTPNYNIVNNTDYEIHNLPNANTNNGKYIIMHTPNKTYYDLAFDSVQGYSTISGQYPAQSQLGKYVITVNSIPNNVPSTYRDLFTTSIDGYNTVSSTYVDYGDIGKFRVAKKTNYAPVVTSGILAVNTVFASITSLRNTLNVYQYQGKLAVVRVNSSTSEIYRASGSGWSLDTSIGLSGYITLNGSNQIPNTYFDYDGGYRQWTGQAWSVYTPGVSSVEYHLFEAEIVGSYWSDKGTTIDGYYKYGSKYYTWNYSDWSEYTITYDTVYQLWLAVSVSSQWELQGTMPTNDTTNLYYYGGAYKTWTNNAYSPTTPSYDYYLAQSNGTNWNNRVSVPNTAYYYIGNQSDLNWWTYNNSTHTFSPYTVPSQIIYELWQAVTISDKWNTNLVKVIPTTDSTNYYYYNQVYYEWYNNSLQPHNPTFTYNLVQSNGSSWTNSKAILSTYRYYKGAKTDNDWYLYDSVNHIFTIWGTENYEYTKYTLYTCLTNVWEEVSFGGNTDYGRYNGNNYYWNTDHWQENNTYNWNDNGSAVDKIFTYGSGLYEYDSINVRFNQIGSSHTSRTKDLVMVVNDLSKLTIENNSFKIYINHYKLS